MNYKYIVLDWGRVIASPTTGDRDITPRFLEFIYLIVNGQRKDY